jgi:hypothetical protein
MDADTKRLVDFLRAEGIEDIAHTGKTYLGHLVNVHTLMRRQGCAEDVCVAGMFHSIYGTEKFQGFTLPLTRRDELRRLIGARAERLAYCNCAMDRASFDEALASDGPEFRFLDRITGATITMTRAEYDDLCRVHLYDWLEQAPRSRYGWGYRRASYRRMAERLGPEAVKEYERVFAAEPASA